MPLPAVPKYACHVHQIFSRTDAVEDLVEIVLQRIQPLITDEQHRVVPLIPVCQGREKSNGCKSWLRQGQHNIEIDFKLSRTIDLGGVN